ncbi:MAG TPA: ATP-binding protein [Candidatus Sulfotelmatobacter sp.]|nr:ATP-binding protein [Candidatus Sulfotelmatobacter sp.]
MAQADCPHCQGSGWKVVERATEGARPLSADKSGPSVGEPKLVWAVPCDCTTGDRSERALARARVPERYRHCDFENYETDNDIENVAPEQLAVFNRSLAQAKLMAQKFAAEFTPIREHAEPGLLLMGPCGVGKTHLAVAALKEIVLRGYGGLFYDYRELLKEIQDSYNAESQSTEMGVLEPVLKAEIFILDDVGSSKPSPWALETVGHVLNTRYNEKRVTLLTTNYLDEETGQSRNAESATTTVGPRGNTGATDSYRSGRLPSGEPVRGAREDTLTERVGMRIRSRLYEMCRTIKISAPDYRKEIRKATSSGA